MIRKKISMILCICMAFLLCACGNAQSTTQSAEIRDTVTMGIDYPVYDTARTLVDAADLVFTGKVTDIRYEMLDIKTEVGADSLTGLEESDSDPYTMFEVEVSHIYKGDITDTTIVLKRPGGKFDTVNYILDGASEINIGEGYLFAVETYEDSYPSLLNANQASYHLAVSDKNGDGNKITCSEILAIFE